MNRKEVKGKGKKERYNNLKAEEQQGETRKPFSEISTKNRGKQQRKGKTRDLFKKIKDTKGTFHAKMGSIKDRNGMDLTEAKDTKKRWQEYTEELYKKRSLQPR